MPIRVSVVAAARLHLGFLDMNGSLGRKFGGLGLAISGPRTRLTLSAAKETKVTGPERERAAELLDLASVMLDPGGAYRLDIHEIIRPHSGLGSGTQLALSIVTALRRLKDLPANIGADAALFKRGVRSGLGVGLFDAGGLVVDGGRGAVTQTPPIVARALFPAEWRILLVSEPNAVGLHGASEREAFAVLPPFSDGDTGMLCRLVLMQALPALAERDIAAFGAAISRIQAIIGDYFAPMQGGHRFTSRRVEEILNRLSREGAVGFGQTSWGPTGFAFVESQREAERLLALAQEYRAHGLDIIVVEGLNYGATINAVYTEKRVGGFG